MRIYHQLQIQQTESVTETIRILGYPTRRNLYTWIAEENTPPKTRKEYPVIDNPPDHPRNPPLEVKLDAIHRCYELGENIKYVSEDIGHSRPSIYQWRKRYLKEGTLGLMNHKNITPGTLVVVVGSVSSTDISSDELAVAVNKSLIDYQKPAIGEEKSAIDDKKSAVDMIKSAIEQQKYNEPSKANILKVYDEIEKNQIFGTKEIKEILDCSPSTARAVMTKLRDMKVVKVVNGKGKGKYVFIE